MRLVHTSDWHLGQRLHDRPRDFEHRRFLDWLIELLVRVQAEALVVAGDVFDSANPPAEAQRLYYEFLAACRRRLPELDIVIVGGNHDSPSRLDAPAEILRAVRVHIVGGLPLLGGGPSRVGQPQRKPGVEAAPLSQPSAEQAGTELDAAVAALDTERAVIPLHRRGGEVAAWLVAVPYLRPSDLPSILTAEPLLQTGDPAADALARTARLEQAGAQLRGCVAGIYEELFAAARRQRQPGQALLAAGHCFLASTHTSLDSERKIQLGNQLPLPVELFPPDVAYVALGHLHLAQCVAGREHIRYSGSPIPLALSEADYPHQVLVIDLDGEALTQIRPEPVPRSVELLRLPAEPRPLAEVLPLLQRLPASGPAAATPEERPYLEVRVQLGAGETNLGLRKTVEDALASAWPRLSRITVTRADPRATDADPRRPTDEQLRDLDPEEVLRRRYQRWRDDPDAVVPEAQLQLFRDLLEEAYHRDLDRPRGGEPADSRLRDAGGPP